MPRRNCSTHRLESAISSVLELDASGRYLYQVAYECSFPKGTPLPGSKVKDSWVIRELRNQLDKSITETGDIAVVYRTIYTLLYNQPIAQTLFTPSVHEKPPIPKWIDDIVNEAFHTPTAPLLYERTIEVPYKKACPADSSQSREPSQQDSSNSDAPKDKGTGESLIMVKNRGHRGLQSDSSLSDNEITGLDSLAFAAAIVDKIVYEGKI